MHVAFLFVLLNYQSIQSETVQNDNSPRIQPNPFKITFQTQRKPVLQDAPPSSFVPPSTNNPSSNTSSSSAPSTTFVPKQTFDPQGSFDPKGTFDPSKKSSIGDEDSKSDLGFKTVDEKVEVKPLRSTQSSTPTGSSKSFSLESNGGAPSSSTLIQKANSNSGGIQSGNTIDKTNTVPKTNSVPKTTFNPNANQGGVRKNLEQGTAGQFGTQKDFSSGNLSQSNSKSSGFSNSSPSSTGLPNEYKRTIGSGTVQPNRSDRSTQLDPAKLPPASTQPEAVVKDETYDPQLREISDLILRSIKRPNQNRFSLQKAVSYAKSANHRKQIVKQYWSSFVVAADLQFAEQEVQFLNAIPSPRTQLDQMLLRAATSSAQARLAETKLAYKKSVSALHRLAPGFDSEQSITFADLPWIGKYTTHSEGYVKSGMFDRKIRQIDSALPAIRDLIYLRGAAVYDNLGALQESISGLNTGLTKVETVLSLHKEVRDQRIEFCKNVRAYNHAIADYAISVFPNATQPLTVAQMLIDTELTLPANDSILDRNVRQASGHSPDIN